MKRSRIGAALFLGLLLLVGVMVVRTALMTVPVNVQGVVAERLAISGDPVARLAEGLRLPTVSHSREAPGEAAPFAQLHALLRAQFPKVHAALTVETVNQHSLLITWRVAMDPPAVRRCGGRRPSLGPWRTR